MCIARLELSTQTCRHRWYRLHHRCSSGLHLGNCTNKLQLQGWETRTEHCPFCEGWPQTHEEYRLLGQTDYGTRLLPTFRSSGNSSVLPKSSQSSLPYSSCSRTPSLSRHLLQTGHDANIRNTQGSQHRRRISSESSAKINDRKHDQTSSANGNLVQGETFGSSSEDTYSSLTHATGIKNRAMNNRLDIYLSASMPGRIVADGPPGYGKIKRNNSDDAAAKKDNVDTNTAENTTVTAGTRIPPSPALAGTSANTFCNQTISAVPPVGASHDDRTVGVTSKQKRARKDMNMSLSKKLGFLFLSSQ